MTTVSFQPHVSAAPRFQGNKLSAALLLSGVLGLGYSVGYPLSQAKAFHSQSQQHDTFTAMTNTANALSKEQAEGTYPNILSARFQKNCNTQATAYVQQLIKTMKSSSNTNAQVLAETLLEQGGLDQHGVTLALEACSKIKEHKDLKPAIAQFADSYYAQEPEKAQRFKETANRFIDDRLMVPFLPSKDFNTLILTISAILTLVGLGGLGGLSGLKNV